jgi:hypothetical protein
MAFEHHSKPLPSADKYPVRVLRYTLLAVILLSFSPGIGVVGYRFLNDETWLDALVDASMILTGMGPVSDLKNDAAKIFASFYSIFSGVAFLSIVAVFLSPVVHRFLHRFHVDENS